MKNPQNITIVLLLIAAVILGALVVGTCTTQNAQAQTSVKQVQFQSQYIFASAPYSGAIDLVYVLNVGARQLNVYAADMQGKKMDLLDTVDLK